MIFNYCGGVLSSTFCIRRGCHAIRVRASVSWAYRLTTFFFAGDFCVEASAVNQAALRNVFSVGIHVFSAGF